MRVFTEKYLLLILAAMLVTFGASAQGNRVLTAKCSVSQTGGGTGYWQVGVTNFSDPGGQITTADVEVGWYVYITDSGTPYPLEITEIVGSPSGSSGTFKVSNVGVTGISSVPTTSSAFISEQTATYNLTPSPVANISGNDNQIFAENNAYLIDQALSNLAGGGGGPTDLTFTGASAPYTLNSSTGTDVTFAAGTNVSLGRVGNELTISATGGSGSTDLTFTGTSSPFTLNSSSGTDVTLAQGSGITLSRINNQLSIASNSTVTGIADLINGIDIANQTGNITVAPNIPELQTVNTYDANDQIMFWDNSASFHRKMSLGTYFGSGFVDLLNTQTNIAGLKGFTTGLFYGSGSLPTGSAFGSTSGTIFSLKGITTMTQSNYSTFGGFTIHNAVDGVNNYTTYLTATGDNTAPAKSGSIVLRTGTGGIPFTDAVKVTPTGRLMTMRGTGVTGSSGGDIIVGSSGLGFESGPIDYVWKSTSTSGQEFVLLEAGGAKCYTGVGSSQWTFPSDIRLKQNVKTLSVLDKMDRLRGVTYELKSDGIEQVGVIAQEIQSAFPSGVRQDDKGYLGVGAMTVAAIALQGAKELYEENKLLKARLAEIERRLAALENK